MNFDAMDQVSTFADIHRSQFDAFKDGGTYFLLNFAEW